MLKTNTYILALALSAGLFSCSETPEDANSTDTVEENQTETTEDNETAVVETSDSEGAEAAKEGDEIVSRYNYEQDWEVFKTAVINKDIKGVSAFASSDIIDAEMLVDAFQDPDFLSALKKATYEDLKVDTERGDEVLLVFSCLLEGSDDEGNTFESGLYLYFSQGDPSLMLENFIAAG